MKRPGESRESLASLLEVGHLNSARQALKRSSNEEIREAIVAIHRAEQRSLEKNVSFQLGQLDYRDRDTLLRLFQQELGKRDRARLRKLDQVKAHINEFGVPPHGEEKIEGKGQNGASPRGKSGRSRRKGRRTRSPGESGSGVVRTE